MFSSELKENEKKLLVVLEKADADFSCEVFDALTYTKTINSDILREWWKKILEAVAAVHAKSMFILIQFSYLLFIKSL